jgi:hypothetical protein
MGFQLESNLVTLHLSGRPDLNPWKVGHRTPWRDRSSLKFPNHGRCEDDIGDLAQPLNVAHAVEENRGASGSLGLRVANQQGWE